MKCAEEDLSSLETAASESRFEGSIGSVEAFMYGIVVNSSCLLLFFFPPRENSFLKNPMTSDIWRTKKTVAKRERVVQMNEVVRDGAYGRRWSWRASRSLNKFDSNSKTPPKRRVFSTSLSRATSSFGRRPHCRFLPRLQKNSCSSTASTFVLNGL